MMSKMDNNEQEFKTFKLLGCLALFILVVVSTAAAHAQVAPNEGESMQGIEVTRWRRSSSTLTRKINKLDDDRVDNLPMPILFGLTPDNLTRNFGDPRSGGRKHEGLDIMAPRGALIVTPTDAVVIRVGSGSSSGNYVYTANPGGETFAYMHLDKMADVDEGDELEKGDFIGFVGNTGNASGGATHLHFEVREDNEGTDPYPRIKSIFPMADKIEYLGKILDNAKNEKTLAESVVYLYRKDLLLAKSLNITLPKAIETAFGTTLTTVQTISRTLVSGMSGDDVRLLQSALGISADGSFGPKTKAALIAFQTSHGLKGTGELDSNTRAALASGAVAGAGCTATTAFSPTTGIKCPVATLPVGCTAATLFSPITGAQCTPSYSL